MVHVTIVKIVFLALLDLGTYLLARSFDAAPAWSALAGVLVMDPEIVFFDEPTAFLDIKGRRAFVEIMKTLGRTSILATHDLELVLELCPRVMVMAGGRLMADGPAEQLLSRGDFMAAAELEVPASLR